MDEVPFTEGSSDSGRKSGTSLQHKTTHNHPPDLNSYLSSSSDLLSRPHDPDTLCQYYTSAVPSHSEALSVLLSTDKHTDTPLEPISLPDAQATSVGGGGRDEGDPVIREINQVLVCVIEQLESVLRQEGGGRSAVGELVSESVGRSVGQSVTHLIHQ